MPSPVPIPIKRTFKLPIPPPPVYSLEAAVSPPPTTAGYSEPPSHNPQPPSGTPQPPSVIVQPPSVPILCRFPKAKGFSDLWVYLLAKLRIRLAACVQVMMRGWGGLAATGSDIQCGQALLGSGSDAAMYGEQCVT